MKLPKKLEADCLRLAGEAPRRAIRAGPGATRLPAGWAVELALPCRVKSESNTRCHWAERARRFKVQEDTLKVELLRARLGGWHPDFPLVVTWTHVGRVMDGDNLAGAFKGLRDALARWLGVDDGDEGAVEWRYAQVAGAGGVRLRVEGR